MTTEADLLQHDMKRAMRRVASSVAIVTAHSGRSRIAMVATAVTSLSLEPPSLIVCVNRNASIFPVLARGGQFCVNVLAGHHRDLAQHCSKASGEARFTVGRWSHARGVPYLEDAQASVFCVVDGGCDYGSHRVIVGRVRRVFVSPEVASLVYIDGGYVEAGSPGKSAAP